MADQVRNLTLIRLAYGVFTAFFLLFSSTLAALQNSADDGPVPVSTSQPKSSVMKVIQITPSINIPAIARWRCTQNLMTHTFAYSYGKPFVGKFRSWPSSPETAC
jgi:peptide N-acetyl-beta-D-glucosaminyl asparaginase amidase A